MPRSQPSHAVTPSRARGPATSRAALLASLALVSGCFTPEYRDCQFTCEGATTCPSGLVCASGHCRVSAEPLDTCEVVLRPDATSPSVDAGDFPPGPDARPGSPDAGDDSIDASVPIETIDAAVPPPPVDAAVPPPPVDAAVPPPPVDAAVPPPPVDAGSPTGGLCEPDEPYLPPCGGQVLCLKSIDAVKVKARVIYAKDVTVGNLTSTCKFVSNGENHWTQGNGGGDLGGNLVQADVIYVKDLKAGSIEVIELRAKQVN